MLRKKLKYRRLRYYIRIRNIVYKHRKKLRFALLTSLMVVALLFMFKAIFVPIDEYGTKEINLVKTNGNTVCQSCMGLYK